MIRKVAGPRPGRHDATCPRAPRARLPASRRARDRRSARPAWRPRSAPPRPARRVIVVDEGEPGWQLAAGRRRSTPSRALLAAGRGARAADRARCATHTRVRHLRGARGAADRPRPARTWCSRRRSSSRPARSSRAGLPRQRRARRVARPRRRAPGGRSTAIQPGDDAVVLGGHARGARAHRCPAGGRAPQIAAVVLPDGADDAELRRAARDRARDVQGRTARRRVNAVSVALHGRHREDRVRPARALRRLHAAGEPAAPGHGDARLGCRRRASRRRRVERGRSPTRARSARAAARGERVELPALGAKAQALRRRRLRLHLLGRHGAGRCATLGQARASARPSCSSATRRSRWAPARAASATASCATLAERLSPGAEPRISRRHDRAPAGAHRCVLEEAIAGASATTSSGARPARHAPRRSARRSCGPASGSASRTTAAASRSTRASTAPCARASASSTSARSASSSSPGPTSSRSSSGSTRTASATSSRGACATACCSTRAA